jgi:sugar transferase (PEP-CTERM/EpsH1 system associated)
VSQIIKDHRVHVACVARSEQEAVAESDLRSRCASVFIHRLDKRQAFARGLAHFVAGGCFSTAFFRSQALHRHIQRMIGSFPIEAVVLLSSGMASYAPQRIPFIADWSDIDSEKWFQYARSAFPGFAYRLEGRRLRRVECDSAIRSRRTFFTTPNEVQIFQSIAPQARVGCSGNGVDFEYFDPRGPIEVSDDLRRREFLAFVGVFNYFPNSDGACWFAENVYPELRRRNPRLELILVGRNPNNNVLRLKRIEGITVTGAVDDVRPYVAAARGVVVPLRIARGIQNKALEALAMGKRVLASEAVCNTFQPELPEGVVPCQSVEDYARAAALPATPDPDMTIRDNARPRFSWAGNLSPLLSELAAIERDIKAQA